MKEEIRNGIARAVENEPFAQAMGMKLVRLEEDYSRVEMVYDAEKMDNIYCRAHGGALFSLIDEAFETVCQARGAIAVALNVSVTYVASPEPGALLRAEAKELSLTRKTASYDIKVTDAGSGALIASCQALAYRTGKPLPFL